MIRSGLSGLLALGAAFAITIGPAALAARLRPYVSISGSMVHLSDLFSGLEAGQDCTLGPAPTPGEQIVVGGAQIQAIADEFGVSWNAGQGSQSVILFRPGETLTGATVIDSIRRSLSASGIGTDSDFTLSGWTDKMVDAGTQLLVKTPALDPKTGRFSAVVTMSLGGQETGDISVEGRAIQMASIVVSARAIMAGQVMTGDDFVVVRRPQDQLNQDSLQAITDAVGLEAVRPMPKGAPIERSALRAPPLVVRGSVVMLRLTGGGLSLSAGGLAVDTGALGDRVRVINPSSKALLAGTVSGRETVSIDPGSTPMIVGNGGGDASLPPGFPGRASFAAYTEASP